MAISVRTIEIPSGKATKAMPPSAMARSPSVRARLCRWLLPIMACLGVLASPALSAKEPTFLEPSQAFEVSARADADAVLVTYHIQEGYYLYRHRLSFASATPGIQIGQISFPASLTHHDEYFGDQDIYRLTPANDFPGEQAKDAISRRLREKVATVKDFIDDKNSFSTPQEAKVAFEKDRTIYLAKLEQCRIEDDHVLNRVVAEEIQKLETGFPGITIWEKQIGGRYRSAQAGR